MDCSRTLVRPRRAAFAAFVALCLFTSAAFAAGAKVTDGRLIIDGGQRFFRGKASNVSLGSYGQAKTPVVGHPYLAIEKNVTPGNVSKVPITISGPITIDWTKVSKTDIDASAYTFLKLGGGKGNLTVATASSAKLVLMKFSINEGDLKDILNKHDTAARAYLKSEGADGRIVSEIYVAMEAELANDMQVSGKVSGNGSVDGIQIEMAASGKRTTSSTVTLAPNTTFAYLLHKVTKWTGPAIDNMEDDRPGIN